MSDVLFALAVVFFTFNLHSLVLSFPFTFFMWVFLGVSGKPSDITGVVVVHSCTGVRYPEEGGSGLGSGSCSGGEKPLLGITTTQRQAAVYIQVCAATFTAYLFINC